MQTDKLVVSKIEPNLLYININKTFPEVRLRSRVDRETPVGNELKFVCLFDLIAHVGVMPGSCQARTCHPATATASPWHSSLPLLLGLSFLTEDKSLAAPCDESQFGKMKQVIVFASHTFVRACTRLRVSKSNTMEGLLSSRGTCNTGI